MIVREHLLRAGERVRRTGDAPPLWHGARFMPETAERLDSGELRIAARIFAGARVRRDPFFDEPFDESLSLEPGAHRSERLESGRVNVLDNHDRFGSVKDTIFGVIDSVRFLPEEGDGAIDVVFRLSGREDLAWLRTDVEAGIITNVSIGYRVFAVRDVTEPNDAVRHLLAIDWEIFEASFVSVPADPGASTRTLPDEPATNTRTANLGRNEVDLLGPDEGTETMHRLTRLSDDQLRALFQARAGRAASAEWDHARLVSECKSAGAGGDLTDAEARTLGIEGNSDTRTAPVASDQTRAAAPAPAAPPASDQTRAAAPAAPAYTPADLDAAATRALQAERARRASIETRLTTAGIPFDDEFAQRLLNEDGMTAHRAADLILTHVAQRDANERILGSTRVDVGTEEGTRLLGAAEDALLLRSSTTRSLIDLPQGTSIDRHVQGNPFAHRSLIDIGCAIAERVSGRRIPTGLNTNERARLALRSFSDPMFREGTRSLGSHSTSDFPSILADVAFKVLRRAFQLQVETYSDWTTRGTLTDYKPARRVQIGEMPPFLLKLEGAEYGIGTVGEQNEQIVAVDYGRMISMTRQMMVNDDLDAFLRIPRSVGAQGQQLISDLVYAHVTGNTVMADGNALFSTAHLNLVTGGGNSLASAGVAALSNMRTLARQQRSVASGDDGEAAPFMAVDIRHLRVPEQLETAAQQLTSTIQAQQVGNVNPFQGSFQTVKAEPRLGADSAIQFYGMADPATMDTIEVAMLAGEDGPVVEQRVDFMTDDLQLKARLTVGTAPIGWRGMYRNNGTT